MKYEEYIDEVNSLPIGEDIEGYLELFNPRVHEIHKNKLILILPNGKCLFMPYANGDKGTRKEIEYTHRSYITKVLTPIIKELGEDEKEFIEANIETSRRDDIIIALMKQGVSLLYNLEKKRKDRELIIKKPRYSIFYVSEKLTEKQKETMIRMKENLEKEKYKMSIYKIFKNLDNSDCLKHITEGTSGKDEVEIDEFYELLGLQKKHDEHDGENR